MLQTCEKTNEKILVKIKAEQREEPTNEEKSKELTTLELLQEQLGEWINEDIPFAPAHYS